MVVECENDAIDEIIDALLPARQKKQTLWLLPSAPTPEIAIKCAQNKLGIALHTQKEARAGWKDYETREILETLTQEE